MKEKRIIPSCIIWLIWLIWPVSILVSSFILKNRSLDLISFVGPIITLFMPILYNLTINLQNKKICEDEAINQAYNNKIKRNNSIVFVCLSLFIELTMITLEMANLGINPFAPILLVLAFGIAAIAIAGFGYIKQSKIEKEFAPYKTIDNSIDKSKYHWGFYINPEDERVIVPKYHEYAGWTINLGNKKGKIVGLGFLLSVALLLGFLFSISSKDISYQFMENALEIKAPLYNRKIDYKNIVEVKLSDEKISATRTNGYGGIKKAYGHFRVKEYGNTMFYCYSDVKNRLFIRLQNTPEEWYILTGKTEEETTELYEKLKAKE